MISFVVNGNQVSVDVLPDTPLLWVLRDTLHLTGTKYGCGKGVCGSCVVLVDDKPSRSCRVEIQSIAGKKVTTIEGIAEDHPVKRAWLEEEVSQCGYCQPGQIMSAVALLERTPEPSDDVIDSSISGNICRCGTYSRIRKAIHRAAKSMGEKK